MGQDCPRRRPCRRGRLEDDPTFDVGRGAHFNWEGHIELEAAIMDGRTLATVAVAAGRSFGRHLSMARFDIEKRLYHAYPILHSLGG